MPSYGIVNYSMGTYLKRVYPWGLNVSGRALCADGTVRNLKRISETADTFFSIPAAVTVKGKTVSGYVTFETVSGFSTARDDDPLVLKFRAYTYGKNSHLLNG